MDAPDSPCTACPVCGALTDDRDLIALGRTFACDECVRESVEHDEMRAESYAPLTSVLMHAANYGYLREHPAVATFDARDEQLFVVELDMHELEQLAERMVAQAPELSAVGS